MAIKLGDYEVVVKRGDQELEQMPDDLPVYDFEGNQVTYKEAKDGYLRQSDYTRKTQQVAEVNKFLVDELGFNDPSAGVATMRRVLETVNDLMDKGIVDRATGEINMPEKQSSTNPNQDFADGGESFSLTMEQLPAHVKERLNLVETLQKDMGQLMAYISRKELKETYPEMQTEEIEMVHRMAAIDPSKSPMEHATSYEEKKKAWGQKAVDAYVESLKKPKEQGHVRPGSGEPALEIYGENPIYTNMPDLHKEGNVHTPSAATEAYFEAWLKQQGE